MTSLTAPPIIINVPFGLGETGDVDEYKADDEVGSVDKVEDVLAESSFMLKTSGIVIPVAAARRIPINKGISSFFLLWKNPFPRDMSLKDVNLSFFEWLWISNYKI